MNDEQLRAWHTAYEDEIAQVIEESRPRCATCRFWVEFKCIYRKPIPEGWNSCLRAFSQGSEPSSPGTLAYAVDQEEYEGYLVTAPDFGCVQHEPKAAGHE